MACGKLIETNLYKMFIHAVKPIVSSKITSLSVEEVNETIGNTINWETWHCCFGHVGYCGLERLLDENLVNGFNVNCGSIKTDCQSFTEAKHTINPFPKETKSKLTVKGKIMHMDLVGPIDIVSLNGNSYFLMLVDDTTWYVIIKPLRSKGEAVQSVKNYVTHLETQGIHAQTFRFDRGRESLNIELSQWC